MGYDVPDITTAQRSGPDRIQSAGVILSSATDGRRIAKISPLTSSSMRGFQRAARIPKSVSEKLRGGGLKPVAVPAGIVCVGGRAIVPRIMIDISVPRIEAVIAGPGATVAPTPAMRRTMPDGAHVLCAHAVAWTEICRRRGDRRAAECSHCNCRRQYQSLHGHTRNLLCVERNVAEQCLVKSAPAGKSKRPDWLNIGG